MTDTITEPIQAYSHPGRLHGDLWQAKHCKRTVHTPAKHLVVNDCARLARIALYTLRASAGLPLFDDAR